MCELSLYDAFIQIVGFILILWDYSPGIWVILNFIILFAKTYRLLWPAHSASRQSRYRWLPIGPIGYWVATRKVPTSKARAGNQLRNAFGYACLLAMLPAAYLIGGNEADDAMRQLVYLPISCAPICMKVAMEEGTLLYRRIRDQHLKTEEKQPMSNQSQQHETQFALVGEQDQESHPDFLAFARLAAKLKPDMRAMFERLMTDAIADQQEDAATSNPAKRAALRIVHSADASKNKDKEGEHAEK